MNGSENPPKRRSAYEVLEEVTTVLDLLSEENRLQTIIEIDKAILFLKRKEQELISGGYVEDLDDTLWRIRSFIGMLKELKNNIA
jgi:hypothetical protein